MSKVIADSTKEIATFRALGARRRDIAQIYLTYGSTLAITSLVIALGLAVAGAFVLSQLYAAKIQAVIIQTTGSYTTPVHVRLLGAAPVWLAAITLGLIGSAVVGMLIPIFFALKRRLIIILREE